MPRVFSAFLLLGLLVASPVWAEDSSTTKTTGIGDYQSVRDMIKAKHDAATAAFTSYKAAKDDTQRLAKAKTYGDRLIDERLEAITKETSRLTTGKCAKVSKVVQDALTASLKTVTDNLNSQKTKLDAATTLDEAKAVIKDVVQSNRVFMFLIPASNGACLAQRITDFIDGKLTEIINKMKTAGVDTTAIEAKMAAAKADAQSAYDIYLQVVKTPGADGNKAKMDSAKALLQKVRQTLGDIKSDIGNDTEDYKTKLKTSTGTPANSTPKTTE